MLLFWAIAAKDQNEFFVVFPMLSEPEGSIFQKKNCNGIIENCTWITSGDWKEFFCRWSSSFHQKNSWKNTISHFDYTFYSEVKWLNCKTSFGNHPCLSLLNVQKTCISFCYIYLDGAEIRTVNTEKREFLWWEVDWKVFKAHGLV